MDHIEGSTLWTMSQVGSALIQGHDSCRQIVSVKAELAALDGRTKSALPKPFNDAGASLSNCVVEDKKLASMASFLIAITMHTKT